MSESCFVCDELTDHDVQELQCDGPRPGGVKDILFALCGNSVLDPSDGTQWTTALGAGFAKEVFNLVAGIDSAEPTLSPKTTACGLPKTLFVTLTGSIVDYNFSAGNFTFWDRLINGYTIPQMLLRICPKPGFDDVSIWLDGEISFTGSPIVPPTDEEAARFELTWTFKGERSVVPTPEGIFD
jgi:hypothetical protein